MLIQTALCINRRVLNELLIDTAEQCANVRLFFEHKLEYMDKHDENTLVFIK